MTTPNGPILFNSVSGGSDTQASGLGPISAVFGAGASTTSTSVTVTGIDTTGVSVGDLLWVETSLGRQFSIIATIVGPTEVTCDDTFSSTAGSLNWAIGGKRATLENTNSRKIFTADSKIDWRVLLESDQTITTAILVFTTSRIGTDGPLRTITQSSNARCFEIGSSNRRLTLEKLKLQNTNVSKTTADGVSMSGAFLTLYDCQIGDTTNKLNTATIRATGNNYVNAYNTLFSDTVSHVINDGFLSGSFFSCVFRNAGSHCINHTRGGVLNFHNCVAESSVGSFFSSADGSFDTTTLVIVGCCFYNIGDAVLKYSSASMPFVCIIGNIVQGCGGYAISGAYAGNNTTRLIDKFNAFWNNTSGDRSAWPTDSTDISLTAAPFVDAAAGDFNINDTAGGGALLRAATMVLP